MPPCVILEPPPVTSLTSMWLSPNPSLRVEEILNLSFMRNRGEISRARREPRAHQARKRDQVWPITRWEQPRNHQLFLTRHLLISANLSSTMQLPDRMATTTNSQQLRMFSLQSSKTCIKVVWRLPAPSTPPMWPELPWSRLETSILKLKNWPHLWDRSNWKWLKTAKEMQSWVSRQRQASETRL